MTGSAHTPDASKWRMPDTLLIVFSVLLISALLTFVLPRGQFDTTLDPATGRQLLQAESFRTANGGEPQPVALFVDGENTGLLSAFFDGMTSGSRNGSAIGVIVFILIVGGSFGVLIRTGAIDEALKLLIGRMQHRARLLLPVMAVLFSLGGAVFGMSEEAMAFAMFLVPLVRMLGYDAITGVLLTYGATQVGFATSWMNPFSVAIAQSIAGLPPLSGAGFRLTMWVAFTLIYITWFMWRAERLRKSATEQPLVGALEHAFSRGHLLVVLTLFVGMVWIIWGVIVKGYYLRELATQFFVIAIIALTIGSVFKLNRAGVNDYVAAFKDGASQLLPAALVVGVAQGIILMLGGASPDKPTVINTLLHHAGEAISGHGTMFSAQAMLVFQSGFNFFVTSGSGQAALTMPLMAPLADLVNVSRQVAVLAFQLGDGLAHLFYPTSPALMGTLAIAGVEFLAWLRAMWPLWILLTVISMSTMAIAVWTGF
ncbi:putative basic amino acid antiporter YfcC [Permianibacter sp. IMCC34836]|uniref:putative basic amino acid antiporter YfcC n=1 Tax=Permianibacter fluminis TaxID=2738515 RepID=UPI001555C7AB|nr:putative basic amino acid antiporter YfcC [Permianibacter fluminis]NQD37577.1 putative basic amino acid antiporter YfcC [Permianibacter fluminis]